MRRSKIQLQALKTARPKYAHGIGLLEVLLFLFIIGATLAVGYAWLMATQQSHRAEERTAILQQANRYIEAFTAANNRLPCPAVDLNGVEDCNGNRAKGYLPYRTISFDASQLQRGVGQLRYLVAPSLTRQRDALLLVDPLNTFEPANWDDTPTNPSTFSFNQVSTADYCRSLATLGNEVSVLSPAGGARKVAYAIADAGSVDEDSDGSLFDGLNADLTTAQMEAPEKTKRRGTYDDNVLARTPTELGFNSDCTSLMMSLNMMSLGVGVVQAAADSKAGARQSIGIQGAIAAAQTAAMIGSFLESSIALSDAIADLTVATLGLAVATAGCAILIGCALIPQYTAAIQLTSVAIVASVAALALTAAAFGPQILFVAATIAVGITAGVAITQSVDVSELRRIAQESYDAAAASRSKAQNAYDNIVADAALARASLTLAYNDLQQKARTIISNANALGVPPGTTPPNALDAQITAFINALEAKNTADFNVEVTKEARKNAQRDAAAAQQAYMQAVADAAAKPTDTSLAKRVIEVQRFLDEKNSALNAAIAAEASAPGVANTAATATANAATALRNASNRSYCISGDCSFVYSGSGMMNLAILNYASEDAKYAPWAKKIAAAKLALDEATAAEVQAKDALDQVNAINPGMPPTGNEVFIWAGAVDILKAADAKGGAK